MPPTEAQREMIAARKQQVVKIFALLDQDPVEAVRWGRLIGPGENEVGVMTDETVLAGLHRSRLVLGHLHDAWGVSAEQQEASRVWLREHGQANLIPDNVKP